MLRNVLPLKLLPLVLVSWGFSPGVAGEYNQVLEIGDPAPQWSGLLGVDGTQHALQDFAEHQAMIVVFTCNSCPYAVDVEDRLIKLQQTYSPQGVALVAINVNRVEEDLMPAMKTKAAEKGFTFPYLFDESQQIAKNFGAKYTPEFFVLDRDRKVAYMGACDDSPDGSNVTARYVESALDSLLAGDQVRRAETVPVGCRIRFERESRSRR